MKINKKRLFTTILDLVVIILTIILTVIAIKYANAIRGYKAFGGEYLIPVFGFILILVIETIYEDTEEQKKKQKNKRNRRK